MSLLLEALKKAELAKQAAKELPLAGDAPFTRDRLPDITQPMEIHSEDLTVIETEAMRKAKPVIELALEEPPPRERAPQPAAATRAAAIESSYSPPGEASYSPSGETMERKQAQQLFEAKELDVNPRKPFYITVGALGLFALGTVGYFWYQLQPRNVYNLPPPSAQPAAPATGGATPRTAPVAAPAAVPADARGPVFARQGAPASRAATAPQPGPAKRPRDITITPARVQSDPVLEGAYLAYNAGDLAKARDDYQQVLRLNPDSRDALLGLAAVETQAKRYDAAENYYTRLLELDPRDAHAQAGLIGLHGEVDPLAAESRLKNMIAAQPEASFLHFTLGNQFAAQGRWAEAQQSYFQAYASDPDNADFAYNLAISLDRLHQLKPALEYYRRALSLAQRQPASFDKARVSTRILQLER